jgi:hypothetical protein
MAGVSRSDREVSMPIAAIDTANDLQRRLIWHGVFLFLLGLIGGLFVYSMTNPRMGLTAHVGTVTNGTFLIAVGAAWRALALSPRGARSACWLLVVGSYGAAPACSSPPSSAPATRRRCTGRAVGQRMEEGW